MAIDYFTGINPRAGARCLYASQRTSLISGDSLAGHVNSQHGGKIDPTCPACKDIEFRQARAKENPRKLNYHSHRAARVQHWENKV